MIKEDETANSDDKRSSQASVTKDPYYPTLRTTLTHKTGLAMMKKMLMNQPKIDWKFDSPICLACITAKIVAMFTLWSNFTIIF